MKKFLVTAASLVAFAAPALAADMAPASYTKAPAAMPAAVYSWTGWYIGVNGGAGWSANNNGTLTGTDAGGGGILAPFGVPQTFSAVGLPLGSSSGGLAGGTVGYNWQMANWVFGIEADADWAGIKSANSIVAGGGVGFRPGSSQVTVTGTNKLQGLETIRGRIGFLATPQFLLFATGGLALGQENVTLQELCPTCVPPVPSAGITGINTTSTTQAGYAVGAGGEWKFAPHWSFKAEYLYIGLGNQSTTVPYTYTGTPSTATLTIKQNYNIARVGVNYQFGGPVVAKY
jgi:outer membrane immunogenic protein